MPWGVVYPPDSFAGLEFGETPIHPSQIYFSLAGLLLFVFLWRMRKRVTAPGTLFWTFIVCFALVRVGLDVTRAYEPTSVVAQWGGLDVTESQLFSLALALFGSLMIMRVRRLPRSPFRTYHPGRERRVRRDDRVRSGEAEHQAPRRRRAHSRDPVACNGHVEPPISRSSPAWLRCGSSETEPGWPSVAAPCQPCCGPATLALAMTATGH